MSKVFTLTAAVALAAFAAGTADSDYSFKVTGTAADGSAFSQVVTSSSSSAQIELPAGTFVLVVSKTIDGRVFESLPSAPYTQDAPAVIQLYVPDSTQAATIIA